MEKFVLEACVDSVESARAAKAGGATRLELCSNLIIGGTTPSQSLFKEIRKNMDISINVLIRPRFGDFCYTDDEFKVIKDEAESFYRLGADGIVIGILKPDGTLDVERMERLMDISRNMTVTLHRAFDVCANPFEALRTAEALGINTILTSGQENTCINGIELLKKLVSQKGEALEILAGSGVSAEVIEEIYLKTGITAYHMSGKTTEESPMIYRKEGVNMGLPCMSEYEIFRTDEDKIRKARAVLESL